MNTQNEIKAYNTVIKAYYAVIPANVRYDRNLSANAKLLYGEITALCNQKGYCWATNNYFLSLYNVSERSVTRWLNELKTGGYIRLLYNANNAETHAIDRCINLLNTVDNFVREGRQFCPTVDNFGGEGRQKCPTRVDKNGEYNNTVNITRIDDEDTLVKAVTKLFPNVVVNERLFLTFDEYKLLAEMYRKSDWLKANFKLISKIHKHKDNIIAGEYNNSISVKTNSVGNIITQVYNADELNALFDKSNNDLV